MHLDLVKGSALEKALPTCINRSLSCSSCELGENWSLSGGLSIVGNDLL